MPCLLDTAALHVLGERGIFEEDVRIGVVKHDDARVGLVFPLTVREGGVEVHREDVRREPVHGGVNEYAQ